MKIMFINGSPRANSATGTLLREAARYLGEKGGTTVELVDLGALAMRLCTGRIACYRTGQCVIRDDGIEEIAARAKARPMPFEAFVMTSTGAVIGPSPWHVCKTCPKRIAALVSPRAQ